MIHGLFKRNKMTARYFIKHGVHQVELVTFYNDVITIYSGDIDYKKQKRFEIKYMDNQI